MGRLTAYFVSRFRSWERPARFAALTAVILLAIAIILLFFSPQDARPPLLIGILGLMAAIQVIFMWANRSMVTPYTQAQRHYLTGDMDTARRILENLSETSKADAQALTLLGNTYRQLGLLDKSEQVLTKAVQMRPFDYFPRYGFGRTLMVSGRYREASDAIQQALESGAPSVVRVELAEACFRSGGQEQATALLRELDTAQLEPQRGLLVAYLQYRLGQRDALPPDLIEEGLPYWEEHVIRFHHTPYGQALADDVVHIRSFLKE
ncbi:MAG: tetratricopeptide repeat protein [Anaerolineaceae bacterium]|nr:tetratricopeptide repeat protein [Anaerolineaceae bacterium]